jgi:hypothetical protein
MCILHPMRYASWSRDMKDKSWINLKVMQMMNLKMHNLNEYQNKEWSSSDRRLTNTNVVFISGKPRCIIPFLVF